MLRVRNLLIWSDLTFSSISKTNDVVLQEYVLSQTKLILLFPLEVVFFRSLYYTQHFVVLAGGRDSGRFPASDIGGSGQVNACLILRIYSILLIRHPRHSAQHVAGTREMGWVAGSGGGGGGGRVVGTAAATGGWPAGRRGGETNTRRAHRASQTRRRLGDGCGRRC